MSIEFDPGPPPDFAQRFAQLPSYEEFKEMFWYDWGPIFYRGRLDGSARVLCIASDPGPTERLALRTLVGDAGQRVQGFLSKIGLTRSYLCLNAFAYALFPGKASKAGIVLKAPAHLQWRNDLFDTAKTANVQAVVAFGEQAQDAVELWSGKSGLSIFNIPHPSSRDPKKLLDEWRAAVTQLRTIVTPDPDGNSTAPNYGTTFREADYAPIPKRDLPWGFPDWFGDDSRGRKAKPRRNNCVRRPIPDDRHTLIWTAPTTE
jgi:uracil-DNA glycosylase